MSFILALDQGTSSSRAILFTRDGKVHAHAQQEFTQIYPQPGWVEHDPFEILTSQLGSAIGVLGKTQLTAADIVAVGITNQRETTVVWDRETGKPVYNAIVWQDRRTAPLCDQLRRDGAESMIREKTGLLVDPYFSGTKVVWILDNVPGARARAEAGKLAFGTIDSWLIWNLTRGGRHVTDPTNASRTMLYNIVEGRWDADLLKLLGIPESMMPEVVWSSEKIGTITTSLGLESIEIAGIAGDQQAALFGQLCLHPGDAKNTYGTGCFLLQHIGDKFLLSQKRLITTLTCSLSRKLEYAFEGSVFIGGAVVQWLRDNLRLIEKSADIEPLAATVEHSDGVVFVPAFVGLGAPYWDPYASGLLIGLRRSTQPGHIARAALESIAFQVADVLEAMNGTTMSGRTGNGESSSPCPELRVDGGASANDLLMQDEANLLGIPVVRPQVIETTALGAAYLAGLASGFWQNPEEIANLREPDTRFEPKMSPDEAQRFKQRWKNALERSRNWSAPTS